LIFNGLLCHTAPWGCHVRPAAWPVNAYRLPFSPTLAAGLSQGLPLAEFPL